MSLQGLMGWVRCGCPHEDDLSMCLGVGPMDTCPQLQEGTICAGEAALKGHGREASGARAQNEEGGSQMTFFFSFFFSDDFLW